MKLFILQCLDQAVAVDLLNLKNLFRCNVCIHDYRDILISITIHVYLQWYVIIIFNKLASFMLFW